MDEKESKKSILRDYIDITHGFGFKGEFFTEHKTENILLTPGNFQIGGGFNGEKLKYYEGPINEKFILNPEDIIITMTDLSKMGDTLGYPAFVPKLENNKFLHNQRLGKIIIKTPEKIDKKFLYYFLCTYQYRSHVIGSSTGTTVKHTSPDRILEIPFECPLIEIQKKIGNHLYSLDLEIFTLKKQNDVLEKIIQTIFKSWFIDFDGQTEFIDSEFGKIPKGWKIEQLNDHCNIVTGKLNSNASIDNGNYLFFTCAKENYRTNTYSYDCEAILLAGNNAVGDFSVKYFSGKFDAYQRTYVITVKKSSKIGYAFILNSIERSLQHLQSISYGTVTKYLTMSILKPFPLLISDEKTIQKFNEVTNPILDKIIKNQTELEQLLKTRDVLLPKLMSGQIKV